MSKLKNFMKTSSSYSQLEKAGHSGSHRRHQPSFASFSDIWGDALDEYHLTTAVNLRDPDNMAIVRQLELYVDPDDILNHLDIVSQSFDRWRQGGKWSQKLRNILKPFVRALHKIIEAIAETASSAGHAPGSQGIFVAILVLLKAADGVSATFDDIEKLFERFRAYVVRLEKQVMAPIDYEMKVLAIRALVEMLRTIGFVTKVLSGGRVWNFMGALVKRSDKIAVAMNKLKEIEYDEDRLNIADLRVAVYDLKRVFEESIAGKQKEDSSSLDDLRGAVHDLRRAFEESVAGKHDKNRLSFADLRRTVYDLKTAFEESVEGRRCDEDPLSIADLCVAVHDLKRVLEENMGDNEMVDESSLGLTSQVNLIQKFHVDSYKTQANPLNAAFDAIEPLNYVDNSNPPSIFSKLDLQTIGGSTWFGLLNSKAVGGVNIEQLGTKRGAIAWQACFSADGRYLAASYLSVAVKVYDVRTAQSVCEINDPTLDERNEPACILATCFSSDARYLVTGGRDGIIRIWDIHTRSLDLQLNTHTHSVVSLSYSRNGTKMVSGSADGTILVWDFICGTARVEERNVVDIQNPLTGDVAGEDSMSVAISPSAHLVAAASLDSVVRVWDATSGVLLQRLRGHMGGVTSIAFTPDGTGLVTGSADHTVMYWDLEDTQLNSDRGPEAPVDRYQSTRCFVGHKDTVTCVAISRDGRWIISGGWDGTVRFWNLETTVLHLLLRGHTDTVKSVDFGLDGDFATGSFDGRVGIWKYTCDVA